MNLVVAVEEVVDTGEEETLVVEVEDDLVVVDSGVAVVLVTEVDSVGVEAVLDLLREASTELLLKIFPQNVGGKI